MIGIQGGDESDRGIIPNAFEMGLGTNMENDVANVEVVHPVERPGEFYTFLNHMINPDSFHTHEQCPVHINTLFGYIFC